MLFEENRKNEIEKELINNFQKEDFVQFMDQKVLKLLDVDYNDSIPSNVCHYAARDLIYSFVENLKLSKSNLLFLNAKDKNFYYTFKETQKHIFLYAEVCEVNFLYDNFFNTD